MAVSNFFGDLDGSVAFVAAFAVGMLALLEVFSPNLRPLLKIDVDTELISGVELN